MGSAVQVAYAAAIDADAPDWAGRWPPENASGSPDSWETFRVASDQGDPEDGQAADDAFDRCVAGVLEREARLLREQSDLLIATGFISVQRPAGQLTARLTAPRWWRRGELEVRAVTAGNSGFARARIPLSRAAFRDLTGLSGEIRLQFAVQLASLEED